MRVLIVCSGNAPNFDVQKHQAFIYDQVEALKKLDTTLQFEYFFIRGKGLTGYLSCFKQLKRQLTHKTHHGIHAHVAVSGLLAALQREVPVITTFHGSDINQPVLRWISWLVAQLCRQTIYVSHGLLNKAIYVGNRSQVIPCGVDFDRFKPRPKAQSRQQLGLSLTKRYILFSSGFDIAVKNYPLAKTAVALLQDETVELLELKNYTRDEVALLFTAVDVALMTSYTEGSPQFVKEALACNCPVVSTDVGDVRAVMSQIAGCFITSYKPDDVAACLREALTNPVPIRAREAIAHFDNRLIAQQILAVYQQIK
jgi:teichuronic acid biosynthesis glycosyltransferase TuaC